jgi:hypothetical protein
MDSAGGLTDEDDPFRGMESLAAEWRCVLARRTMVAHCLLASVSKLDQVALAADFGLSRQTPSEGH